MMGAAFRTRPFPDSQVLDVLVYVATLRTCLATSEPFINFDKVITLVLEHVDKHTPATVGYSLRKVVVLGHSFYV